MVFSSWQRFRLAIIFVVGVEIHVSVHLINSLIPSAFSHHRWEKFVRLYAFFFWPVPSSDWFHALSISSPFDISEEFTIMPYSNRTLSNYIFERTVMFLPTSLLIKLRHLLHSKTVFHISYPHFFNLFIILRLYLIVK